MRKSKGRKRRVCRGKKGLRKGLERMNLKAGGIDIGSERHYVAVPGGTSEEVVRNFGCLTPDLHEMAKWLKECGVETVAMESTGVYWIPVAEVLESYGIEINLADTRQVKNVPGRKTDVSDCQWLQELHTFGLIRGAFRPDQELSQLRTYWRHRSRLTEFCAQQIHLMQKALEQMNVQLHKVLSDITGLTGMKIIRAIVAGERDPLVLAQLKHPGIRSTEETLAKALTGNYRSDHVFELEQAVETYDFQQRMMEKCDREIEQYMKRFESKADPKDLACESEKSKKQSRRKNEPYFDLKGELHRITGVDLTKITGISAMTAQTVITEQGFDMSLFPTEKNFTSHLGLCPNNRITGGKIYKTKSRNVQSRAAKALRVAAQSLHHSNSALGAFYRRMRSRLGSPKAITATARKLACIIYRMLKYGEAFVEQGQDYYERKYQERRVKNMQKQAKSMGYMLVP